jgi:hypothetical protein
MREVGKMREDAGRALFVRVIFNELRAIGTTCATHFVASMRYDFFELAARRARRASSLTSFTTFWWWQRHVGVRFSMFIEESELR